MSILGKIIEEILKSRRIPRIEPRKTAPPKVRRWIEANRNKFISKIVICRKPIRAQIRKVANIITLGKFDKSLKSMKYEDIFHLYLFITLGNKTYRIEKNEIVDLKQSRPTGADDCMKIDLRGKIFDEEPVFSKTTPMAMNAISRILTLGEFMDNGEKYQNQFWSYNANGNNCQNFAESLLLGSNLIRQYGNIHKFIKQDSEEIFRRNPKFVAKLGKVATDIAGIFRMINE